VFNLFDFDMNTKKKIKPGSNLYFRQLRTNIRRIIISIPQPDKELRGYIIHNKNKINTYKLKLPIEYFNHSGVLQDVFLYTQKILRP